MVAAGVYAILLTQTLNALGTMVLLPTMPFYMMELGANAFTISLLGSAYNLAQMFCSPALGSLSDRMGRKRVMLMGLTAQAVCNGLMSYAFSVPSLILARMMVGVALSTGPVEMAYIMDFVDEEQELSKALALQRIMTSAGALAGPVVARCFDDLEFPLLCRGLVCLNMLELVIGILFWKDAPEKELPAAAPPHSESSTAMAAGEVSTGVLRSLRSMLVSPATGVLLMSSFMYTVGCNLSDGPEIVFFKEHFGFGKDEVSYFFMITNVSSLCCSAFVPALIESFGPRVSCVSGCLGYSVMVLTLVVFPGIHWTPYVFGYAVGLFGSLFGLGFMHLARQGCAKSKLGALLGLQSSLNGAAGTLAPPLGGALYDWSSFVPYVSHSLCSLVAAGLFLSMPESPPQETEPLVVRPTLRRLSTFGKPIFPAKDFTTQVHINAARIEQDPELYSIYEIYRGMIDKERGGVHGVATVSENLSDAARVAEMRDKPGLPRRQSFV
eukprot:CAMPEP_0179026588 /NCGR_PEP_ID=MMETSP0796-20121207/8592_1 /TAXON_ID=73915 /ORGANISM="Pyrodinium bahamense, Strain pbaha01" /LENGTH=495 /DNA_ID=CAMNT_0020722673 /DNA_START=92 /DNA_END=1579 /DNA_ORIENTATION=-